MELHFLTVQRKLVEMKHIQISEVQWYIIRNYISKCKYAVYSKTLVILTLRIVIEIVK